MNKVVIASFFYKSLNKSIIQDVRRKICIDGLSLTKLKFT
jgi:hypothetical protein